MNETLGPYAGNFGGSLASRIDRQSIQEMRADFRAFHGVRLRQHTEDEKFFKRTFFVPTVDDNRDPLRTGTATQIVETLINHVVAEMPIISVAPRNQDDSEQKKASKLTVWLNGYWAKVKLPQLMRRMVWFDAVRGCHVLRIVRDKSLWPPRPVPPVEPAEPSNILSNKNAFLDYLDELTQYQEDKDTYQERLTEWRDYTEQNLPIVPQVLDPQYVFWEPGEEPGRCIIAWDRPVDDIVRQHPKALDYLGTMRSGSRVTWCEYWDDEEYAYWIEPQGGGGGYGEAPYWVQDPKAHGFGFFPFVIDGPWKNPLQEAENQFPSIYFAIREMLQYESTLYTQMAHMLRKLGWPILLIKTDQAHNDQAKPLLSAKPGAHNYLDKEEDARYLELSGSSAGLIDRVVNDISEKIDEGTGLADILRGEPKGKSGYQQAQIAAMARVALVPVEQCMRTTLESASGMVLRHVKKGDEKITVIGPESTRDSETAIGPSDVRSHGRIKVQLKTVLPIDESAKIANYMNMQEKGWISPIEAARMAGIENPEEKAAEAMAWKFSQQPFIQQAEAINYIKEHRPEIFQIIQEFQLMQQKEAAQHAQNPPPQRPPGTPPEGPPPGGTPPHPPQAGGAAEHNLVKRQAKQGGRAPKGKLAETPEFEVSTEE